MTGDTPVSILSGIAAILNAVAWPLVLVAVIIAFRSKIATLFDVLTKKLATASKVKAWQLEIESAEQDIKDVVDKAASGASVQQLGAKIPENQLQAAQEVDKRLRDAPISQSSALGVVQKQIRAQCDQYEQLRNEMPGGSLRTRRMNEIAAKMRSLSLAARPLLDSFVSSQSVGERLAAICILQVAPDYNYFPWLIERIKTERQPFIFFQAAVAVLELVKGGSYRGNSSVKREIESALQHVSSFAGGTPDKNTIDVLNLALSKVS